MSITQEEYQARRKKVMSAMRPDSIALLPAAKEQFRNADCEHSYRQHSDFHYLTGFDFPEAVLALIPGRTEGEYILFNQPKDPKKEVWTGIRPGQAGACKDYLADQAFSIDTLKEKLPELMQGKQHIYYPFARSPDFDALVNDMINNLRAQVRAGAAEPLELINIESIIHEMRLIKSPAEIDLIRKSVEISVDAHLRAMRKCKPGLFEYQIETEIRHECAMQGSKEQAYTPIVAGGKNACILHYIANDAPLNDGDLLLIDAGGEHEYYSSDLTRAFPVNGRYSPEQRDIYNAVLRTQSAVIEHVRPGTSRGDLDNIATRTITSELVKLGLLQGDLNTLIEEEAYTTFYMHRIGHWLGLDVHDAGKYKVNNQWRKLEPGIVLTVEPGIYIAENTPNVDPKWWSIGVRIEDDILVTKDGCDILSKRLPQTPEEIEAIMRQTA